MTDWFTRAVGHAVADVRTVLIDEGWFGRRDSPTDHSLISPQQGRRAPDAERDPLRRSGEPEYDPQREFEDGFRRGFEHGVERGSEPQPGHAFEIVR